MQTITRKDAILAGENTYFTGKQCKNGHIAYRYVQSGTCTDCVNLNRPTATVNGLAREERLSNMATLMREKEIAGNFKAEAVKAFKDRKAIVENDMVAVKLRLFPEGRNDMALLAYGMAAMREPSLLPEDIHPSKKPIGGMDGGTTLFQFYCFAEDIDALRAAMNESQRKYMTPPEIARRQIFQTDEEFNAQITFENDKAREISDTIRLKGMGK